MPICHTGSERLGTAKQLRLISTTTPVVTSPAARKRPHASPHASPHGRTARRAGHDLFDHQATLVIVHGWVVPHLARNIGIDVKRNNATARRATGAMTVNGFGGERLVFRWKVETTTTTTTSEQRSVKQ